MSSVVCQGLRSCLKPRLTESILLMHKLSPPSSIPIFLPQQHHLDDNSHDPNNIDEEEDNNIDNNNKVTKNEDLGGWSFLNALANPTQFCKQVSENKEKAYVHPMVKSFGSSLSSKSLEMCTESLGCETGCDMSENTEQVSSKEKLIALGTPKLGRRSNKKVASSFPPPLTSISGSDGVRVRPHREGGRLVIKAVSISSCGTNFQAERANGRLKLSLVKECFQMEEEIDETEGEVDNEEEEDLVEDMDGNVGKVEGGNGEFSKRPSRCKEGGNNGNKVISDWRSFWVAIS